LFFIVFVKPSDAVRFALLLQNRLRALAQSAAQPLPDRIGIHIGEVVIEEREGVPKPKDLYGVQVGICARVMSLAGADQILLTWATFDNARQVLKGEELASPHRDREEELRCRHHTQSVTLESQTIVAQTSSSAGRSREFDGFNQFDLLSIDNLEAVGLVVEQDGLPIRADHQVVGTNNRKRLPIG
jgi:hypothetical protein